MPYNVKVTNLLNHVVIVAPIHGCGWHRVNEDGSYSHSGEVAVPAAFRFRILDISYRAAVPVVACGRIEQKGHPFDSWWAALVPIMDESCVDFAEEAANCGTLI